MNNKVVLKIVVICAAVFLVFGILATIFAAKMTVNDWDEGRVFSVGKGEPFEYHKSDNFDIEGVTQININTVSTDVVFYQSDNELEITLDCKGYSKDEAITLTAEQAGSVINAKVKYPKTFWGINITESLLSIGIPADYDKRIKVDGVSSRVSLTNIPESSFEKVDIDTVSGNATVLCKSIELLEYNSTSGRLDVEQTQLGSVNADTTSGDMQISNINNENGSVEIDTVSGRINLVYDILCETRVHTTSGDVRLNFPQENIINLDFDSTSGDLNGNYNKNSDGKLVKVDTVSGDLTIN